jgi:hypothetical protein
MNSIAPMIEQSNCLDQCKARYEGLMLRYYHQEREREKERVVDWYNQPRWKCRSKPDRSHLVYCMQKTPLKQLTEHLHTCFDLSIEITCSYSNQHIKSHNPELVPYIRLSNRKLSLGWSAMHIIADLTTIQEWPLRSDLSVFSRSFELLTHTPLNASMHCALTLNVWKPKTQRSSVPTAF